VASEKLLHLFPQGLFLFGNRAARFRLPHLKWRGHARTIIVSCFHDD
jgi:hypothetical protein